MLINQKCLYNSGQVQIISFDPDDLELWTEFEAEVAKYCYMVNIFPDVAESESASHEIAVRCTTQKLDFDRYK